MIRFKQFHKEAIDNKVYRIIIWRTQGTCF